VICLCFSLFGSGGDFLFSLIPLFLFFLFVRIPFLENSRYLLPIYNPATINSEPVVVFLVSRKEAVCDFSLLFFEVDDCLFLSLFFPSFLITDDVELLHHLPSEERDRTKHI